MCNIEEKATNWNPETLWRDNNFSFPDIYSRRNFFRLFACVSTTVDILIACFMNSFPRSSGLPNRILVRHVDADCYPRNKIA